MNRSFDYVLLDRVDTLRLTCRAVRCSGTIEISLARIGSVGKQVLCPDCGAVLRPQVQEGEDDAFNKLAQAVEDMKRFALLEHLRVELVFPRG